MELKRSLRVFLPRGVPGQGTEPWYLVPGTRWMVQVPGYTEKIGVVYKYKGGLQDYALPVPVKFVKRRKPFSAPPR